MRARAPLYAVIAAMALAFAGAPARADDDKQMAQHKITQAKSYVPIRPMYATILDGGQPVGLLLVHIGLSVSDEGLRAQTEHALPVLRDAYLRNLMIFAAAAVRPWQQPDVTVIANRLQRVTDRALHSKGAKVLLGQVMIRISR